MSETHTESDYDFDLTVLMAVLGVDPAMVEPDTARLDFIQGKAVLRYGVIRAIPSKLLAVAFAKAGGLLAPAPDPEPPAMPLPIEFEPTEPGQDTLIVPEMPGGTSRPTKQGRRTAKKAAKKS